MALFDIFTDVFTGDPAKEAAAKQREFLSGQIGDITNILGGARTGGLDALRSSQESALGALVPAYTQGQGVLQEGIQNAANTLYGPTGFFAPAESALTAYTNAAANALAQAQPEALKALYAGTEAAARAYDPLARAGERYGARATQSSDMEADALGLNGPEGVARARSAFRARPGYQFTVDEALKQATRGANVGGMVAGGNVLQELTDRASSLADLEYNDWMDRLMGREKLYAPLEAGALGDVGRGQAQAYLTRGTGAADIFQSTGSRLADVYSRAGPNLANLYTTTAGRGADVYGQGARSIADLLTSGGRAQADIYGKTGTNIANLLAELARAETSARTNLATPFANTFGLEAEGALGGSANLFSLLGGLGSFVSKGGLSGLGSGLSSLVSGIGSLF